MSKSSRRKKNPLAFRQGSVNQRIVKMCKYLDEGRAFFGNRPMRITSGYRDPLSNRSVGGARDSRHMYDDAVDFWVEGMEVVDVFYKLKSYHPRGRLEGA